MPTYRLSPNAKQQFFKNDGSLAAGYFLYTYAANSTTPRTTFVAQDGGDNNNPIELDARGEASIWLDPSLFYKYVLKTTAGVEVWTVDYVSSGEGADTTGGATLVTGQCVLQYTNSTTITLARLNGSKLYIDATEEDIPSDGITLDTTGLSVDTVYNIFSYMVGDVMTLVASTDAHFDRATNGIEIRDSESPNGSLYSYVGSALTISSSGTKWSPTGVYSWFNSPYGVASQAQQETATSLTLAVTPGRQHSHPSAAKAWCKATVAGVISTSFNMTSVTDGGVGQITFTVDTDFSSANWAALALGLGGNGGASATTFVTQAVSQAAGTLGVTMVKLDDYQVQDPTNWQFVGFGDQA